MIDPNWILAVLPDALRRLETRQSRLPAFEIDETLRVTQDRAREVLSELIERLDDNYPFRHPSYAGQMLKPPHPIASTAYFLTQQINPNNHALDGGPATAKMETEVVAELATMFGYANPLGHLTSSGTLANLEALWVARQCHPEKAVAFSSEAHYTHGRMCEVIGAKSVEIGTDATGRIDLDRLRDALRTGRIGTVVLTTGTTSLGAVDPVDKVLNLRREFDFRIHIDGAYGGFFKLLADTGLLSEETSAAYRAVSDCDSIVVDPHKHGLQPYGCGSVLFRDPTVGRFYKHDSPYTYFTSAELHLGEISLECSRAGAAAAALWATLKCFPLKSDTGLGAVLRKCRSAAVEWARLIEADEDLNLAVSPSLDIVTFFPKTADNRASSIGELVNRTFSAAMNDPEHPIFLAKLHMKPELLRRFSDLAWNQPTLTVFRSVLMKPEHLEFVRELHARVRAFLISQRIA